MIVKKLNVPLVHNNNLMKKISCGPFIYENTKYKDVLKKEEMGVYPHFPSPRALDKFLNPDYTHEEKN